MINLIIRNTLLFLLALNQITFSYAQTASLLPNGMQQFFDNNGNPLTAGTVDFYIPSTTTRKNTWQDSGETILNANPVILDAAGRALIYGDGAYRQILKDNLNNLIWDKLVTSNVTGGTIITTGDGDAVGTIKPWAGLLAPNQYVFAFGQEVSRVTFAALLTAITQQTNVICTSASNTVTGLSDTTQIPIGAAVEITCVPAGTTVVSKTTSSLTFNNSSNVSLNASALIFPYGNGNGTTTFNIPDLRGYVVAGRDNMGDSAANRFGTLNSFFGANNPDAIGAKGGNASNTLLAVNLPSHNHTNNVIDPGHLHTYFQANSAVSFSGSGTSSFNTNSLTNTSTSTTGITVTNNNTGGSGLTLSATLVVAGSGYTNGAQVLTVSGGTCSVQPSFNVTVAGNVVTTINSIANAGNCSVPPINPVTTTGGGGTGATLNVAFTTQAFATIQPTITLNYIIKVTPDSSNQSASGVASLGGQIGAIGCTSGILCTGNNVSVNPAYTFSLGQGGLGGTQAAATVNQIPVFPGTNGPAVPTSAPTWFDQSYCNTIGYLIVRIANAWTCNNSIPANVDWFANVAGNGSSDDTAGINAVLAAVNGRVQLSGGKVYCVKTAAGLTSSIANQIIEGSATTLVSACGTDSNVFTLNADSIQIKNVSILGGGLSVSSNHHDIVLGTACTRCHIEHVVTAGGYYNVLINAAYTFIYDLRTGNAHGPAVIKLLSSSGSSPGVYLDSSQVDQNWPVSAPTNLASISAWTNAHVYNVGDVVSTNGYYIQARVGGTSAGVAPTLLDYGNDIADGATLKWRLVAPTTFDGLSIDTGSVNVVVTRSDFTGPYTNGAHTHNSLAGTAPLEISLGYGNTFAQNITACINAQNGTVLNVHAAQCQNGVMVATIGVWLQSTFTGNYQIDSTTMLALGNSSDGILDQAGASNGGSIVNNLIYNGATGISIGANLNNRSIIGNHAGSSSLGTNAACIFVSPGTGDYLNIDNNDCNGASSSQITVTGVTGIHNKFCNAGVCGSSTTTGTVLYGPSVTVNFGVAGDTALPVLLPPGFTATIQTQITINNCTANIAGATYGVFTTTGGGGTPLIASGTSPTVTATTANTNNNIALINATNVNTQSYTPVGGNFQFRVGTTVVATCLVYVSYKPASL